MKMSILICFLYIKLSGIQVPLFHNYEIISIIFSFQIHADLNLVIVNPETKQISRIISTTKVPYMSS